MFNAQITGLFSRSFQKNFQAEEEKVVIAVTDCCSYLVFDFWG